MAAGRPLHCGFASISRAPLCAGVKGLAPVFFGLVFYRRLAGCRQAENSPKFGNGFGA
jgi:hypothetical protein